MSIFSENLKHLRKQKKISQVILAKELEISPSAVTMYEQGKREPNFELLKRISEFFQVDYNNLLGKQIVPCEAADRKFEYMPNQDIDDLIMREPQTDYLIGEGLSNKEKDSAASKSEDDVISFVRSNPIFNDLMRVFEKIDKNDIEKFISFTQEITKK